MKKHLISLSDRQDIIFRDLSKELETSFSELLRRALDEYIENRVKDGALVQFTFSDGSSGKSIDMETPKGMFKKLNGYVKSNPNSCFKKVR